MTEKRILSIWEQAAMIDRIVDRCTMHDGSLAGEATIVIDKETAEHLHHLSIRLERLAPHEERLKQMVKNR